MRIAPTGFGRRNDEQGAVGNPGDPRLIGMVRISLLLAGLIYPLINAYIVPFPSHVLPR